MTRRWFSACLLTALAAAVPAAGAGGTGYTLVGWNNLGMHCMDADFSLFSILPPYNTIHAQLTDANGNLVTAPGGITVWYEAVTDPSGSINTTSSGKTNFWDYILDLFGVSKPVDTGLTGVKMPGGANTPQPMTWDPAGNWWIAEGIPITPKDDSMAKMPYPMFRLTAKDGTGAVLATTDIVLPVSDEMTCTACHASGTNSAAEPSGGWANDPNEEVDYRKNILLLHDDRQGGTTLYTNALAASGYNASGLYATAVTDGKPVLCAGCHGSNALGTTSYPGVKPLTGAVHMLHAAAVDPATGLTLDSTINRSACYRCHPGAVTRCLRGVMGGAVAPTATLLIQCQNCHGGMSRVGAPTRQGWLDEPTCQNCHTGTAVLNNGLIRYTDVFDTNGLMRQAVDQTFATTPNVPAPGTSLYRFSYGHGGVACEGCHGSTHAESPATHVNDNVQNVQIQGHVGPLVECTSCHATTPNTISGGPHGLHPVGQVWVSRHPDIVEQIGAGGCRKCHGTDLKGTVLSWSQADRTITAFGTKSFWRGFQIGCYACHKGPGSENANPNKPPRAGNAAAAALSDAPLTIPLTATDADGNPLTLRVVSQTSHGLTGITGFNALYVPDAGFQGTDTFTFAAWDGQTNSNLGTVTITVGPNNCSLSCSATVPATGTEGVPVSFAAVVTTSQCVSAPAIAWTFGDTQTSSQQNVSHTYVLSGTYNWSLTVSADGHTCTKSGAIVVEPAPPTVTAVRKLTKPFRIAIRGTNFHPTMEVFIDGTQWTNFSRSGSTKIVLKSGKALKALFPANTSVPIRLHNPDDGQEVTVTYNITTKQWAVVP